MQCRTCGTTLRPGSAFCPNCGTAAPHNVSRQEGNPGVADSLPGNASDDPACEYHLSPAGALGTQKGATDPVLTETFHPPGALPLTGEGALTGQSEEASEDVEEEGPVATFNKKRIAFKTLSRPLQVLLAITFVQIVVVAVLLLTQNIAQPLINSGVTDAAGTPYQVSIFAFIAMALSLVTGYWFALAGALRVDWRMRFLVVALVTGLLAYHPIIALVGNITSPGEHLAPFTTENWLRAAQLGVLAVFWMWAIGLSVRKWRTWLGGTNSQSETRPWHGWSFAGVLAFLLIYYGLEFGVWLAYVRAGLAASESRLLLQYFGMQSLLLPTFLALLFLWGSTDLLEWGELLSWSMVALTRRTRLPWLLLILTLLAALGMLVNALRLDGGQVLLELVISAGLAGIGVLLARFARIGPDWPAEVPGLVVLLGAIFLYGYLFLLPTLTAIMANSLGLLPQFSNSLYIIVATPVGLAVLTVGLFLIARGRVGKPAQGAVGLFLALVVLLLLTVIMPSFLSAAGVAVAYPAQHFTLLNGMQALAALGTLVWLASLFVRQRSLPGASRQLAAVFLLLAGLQIVSWVLDVLHGIVALSSLSTLWLAGLFLLTVLWGLITAGEGVMNTESSLYPREGRTLFYLGYTLIANAMLLYLGALQARGTGAGAPDYLTSDDGSLGGLLLLGPPLVMLSFLLRTRRRVPRDAVTPASQTARGVSSRSSQIGILGSGVLITALVVVFVLVNLVPGLVHVNTQLLTQPYRAAIPGPGCDTGDAGWVVLPSQPIRTSCQPAGLQIETPARSQGAVHFTPPGGTFPRNYRVSVQFNAGTLSTGCIFIEIRASEAGYYQDTLCSGLDSGIILVHDGHTALLVTGHNVPAKTYTLEATTSGQEQRLAINGAMIGSVSDATLSTTDFIALGVSNFGNQAGTVALSDFVFTPLP